MKLNLTIDAGWSSSFLPDPGVTVAAILRRLADRFDNHVGGEGLPLLIDARGVVNDHFAGVAAGEWSWEPAALSDVLDDLEDIHQGQTGNLVIDVANLRVWRERHDGSYVFEEFDGERWYEVDAEVVVETAKHRAAIERAFAEVAQ